MALDQIQLNLLKEVAGIHEVPEGAYSLRINGQLHGKNSSENIVIEKKTDKPGIDIYIKDGTKMVELQSFALKNVDFTEEDINIRNAKIIDSFMEYIIENGLSLE